MLTPVYLWVVVVAVVAVVVVGGWLSGGGGGGGGWLSNRSFKKWGGVKEMAGLWNVGITFEKTVGWCGVDLFYREMT